MDCCLALLNIIETFEFMTIDDFVDLVNITSKWLRKTKQSRWDKNYIVVNFSIFVKILHVKKPTVYQGFQGSSILSWQSARHLHLHRGRKVISMRSRLKLLGLGKGRARFNSPQQESGLVNKGRGPLTYSFESREKGGSKSLYSSRNRVDPVLPIRTQRWRF